MKKSCGFFALLFVLVLFSSTSFAAFFSSPFRGGHVTSQIYHGTDTTNPYWNGANDGAGSGLDADSIGGAKIYRFDVTDAVFSSIAAGAKGEFTFPSTLPVGTIDAGDLCAVQVPGYVMNGLYLTLDCYVRTSAGNITLVYSNASTTAKTPQVGLPYTVTVISSTKIPASN